MSLKVVFFGQINLCNEELSQQLQLEQLARVGSG